MVQAAITALLLQPDGEKLAIGLLPAYINRRPSEIELVSEVIQESTLDGAFVFLCTLDDPVDKYTVMQKLCRADWLRGAKISDFFYKLKRQSIQAGASLDLVCNIIMGQLPKVIQGNAKAKYANGVAGSAVTEEARGWITEVRKLLNERGLPLDVGCTNRDELSNSNQEQVGRVVVRDEEQIIVNIASA